MREYNRVRQRFWRKGIFLGIIIVGVGIFLSYGHIPSGRALWGVVETFARGDEDSEGISLREAKIQGALAALDDAWPEVQAEALSALGELDAVDRIPRSVFPRIGLLLKHAHNDVRLIAIETLTAVSAKEFLPQIAAFLVYDDADIRIAAVTAVGNMGIGQEDIYLSQVLLLLNDRERQVRRAAVKALRQLDRTGESYLPQLVELLDHKDADRRIEALMLLGTLREEVVPYLPRIVELLQDQEQAVRIAAAGVLGKLGELAEPAIPHIVALLQDQSPEVRVAAVRSLSRMASLEEAYRQQIIALLAEEEQPGEVRAAVIEALEDFDGDRQVLLPMLVEHVADDETRVRVAAIETLGTLGTLAEPHVSQLTALLEDENWEVRAAAVEALGQMGEIARPAIPQIVALLDDEDWFVRSNAIRAVGALVPPDDDAFSKLLVLLDDDDGNVRAAVTWVLGNLGKDARGYELRFFGLLHDPHPGVRYAAARALKNLGETRLESLPVIANLIAVDSSRTAELRFLAHSLGAGRAEAEMFLQWFGNPGKDPPAIESLPYDQAKMVLTFADAVWPSAAEFGDLHVQIAELVGGTVENLKAEWRKEDLPLLKRHVSHLAAIDSPYTTLLQNVARSLTVQSVLRSPFLLILVLCLLHPLMWLGLLLVYPVSSHVRTLFFWNSYIRKIVGLGYIHVALIKLSLLRQRLFEPFRQMLLSDAALADFDDSMYFKDSEVYAEHAQVIRSIDEAIPEIQGKIVIEGESGLGKTMFARYLLKYATRPVVYLPAEKCRDGVIAAIQPKFGGEAKDVEFLRSLVCAGGLDICIDGLDTISAKNRLCITRFLTHTFKGNALVTTQATDWTPPAIFRTYIMQPLDYGQIEDFLINCYRILPEDVPMSHSEYTLACKNYLAQVLDENLPLDIITSTQQILAIPINITMVALLTAYSQNPDLSRLPEQCYRVMDEECRRMNQGQPFQLMQFSERVYRMRLNDEATIPHRRFSKEIACMAHYKMVLSRHSFDVYGNPTTEWYFRHEKMMDFFMAEAFLSGNNHRLERHLEDSRFQGVYTLLAMAGLLEGTGYRSEMEPDTDYPNVIKLADVV